MHVKLVIVGGKANRSRVSVELPAVIGRSREADLTVAHPMISRKHCELFEVDGLVMIRDLGSLNGLFVGGTQVSEAALHPNAEFTVGPLTFRVEYEYVRETAASPDATTINENRPPPQGPGAPEAEFRQPGPDVELHVRSMPPRSEGTAVGDQPVHPYDELTPAEGEPAIAPPDGQLPDFSAWEVDETEQAEDDQPGETLPPPPAFFGLPPGLEESTPETRQAGPPEPAPPPPVAPTPETTADEETGGSTADGRPDAGNPEGEGQFDLAPPPGPDVDESDDAGPSNELDKFLKELQ